MEFNGTQNCLVTNFLQNGSQCKLKLFSYQHTSNWRSVGTDAVWLPTLFKIEVNEDWKCLPTFFKINENWYSLVTNVCTSKWKSVGNNTVWFQLSSKWNHREPKLFGYQHTSKWKSMGNWHYSVTNFFQIGSQWEIKLFSDQHSNWRSMGTNAVWLPAF